MRSVANLTRADGEAFFRLAEEIDIRTAPVAFPLEHANEALAALREGDFDGAAVLLPEMGRELGKEAVLHARDVI